ncbi:MAG: hypothetical protein QW156_04805 [Candidatus Aenigmatarchaeota archaeon]
MIDYIDLIILALSGAISVFSIVILKGLKRARAIIDEIERAIEDGKLTREEILEIIKRFKGE